MNEQLELARDTLAFNGQVCYSEHAMMFKEAFGQTYQVDFDRA